MKRYGNLFEKIYNKQNIFLAHQKARKKKTKRKAIKDFDNNISEEINKISEMIKNKTYKVSPYKIDKRIERKKERIIYKLPYNPDRIIHHAVLQIIEPILAQTYIKDTYQSIKNRGVHKAKDRIKQFLKEKLKLNPKENYQVFPTYIRGIDFLGFRFFDNYIILRKSIKKEIIKLLNKKPTHKRLLKYNSYYGWLKATNSYNLMRKYITKDLIFQYQKICDKIKINNIFDKIKIKPKKLNKYGYYQPTLLNFI